MRALIVYLLLTVTFPVNAASVDCSGSLGAEHARFDAALRRAFFLDEWHSTETRLGRLDADIRAWFAGQLAKLSPARRQTVFMILETRPDDPFEMPTDSGGAIAVTSEGVQLLMNSLESRTEYFRYVILHELGHLLRIAEAGGYAATEARLDGLQRRPLGVYREEMFAEREVYRWVQRNFTRADFERLHALANRHEEFIARGKELGLDMSGDQALVEFHGPDSPRRAVVNEIMESGVAEELAYFVERIFEAKSEAEYLKNYALAYRGAQRQFNRVRFFESVGRRLARRVRAWRG